MSKSKPENNNATINTGLVAGGARVINKKKYIFIALAVTFVIIAIGWGGTRLWNNYKEKAAIHRLLEAQKRGEAAQLKQLINEKDIEITSGKDPNEKVSDYTAKAYLLIQQDRLDDAITALLAAVKIQPSNADVLTTLGRIYALKKDKTNSLKYYNQAIDTIKADPKSPYVSNLPGLELLVKNIQNGDFSIPEEQPDATTKP